MPRNSPSAPPSTPTVNYDYGDDSGTGTTAHYVRINKVLYPNNNGTSVGAFTYGHETWAAGAARIRVQYGKGMATGDRGR